MQQKLVVQWDKGAAEWRYLLLEYVSEPDENTYNFARRGDRKWAERTARHYKIELPAEPEE